MVRRLRFLILIALIIIIPAGFATKWFRGIGAYWINNYFSGILYELFWCLVALFIWPRASAFQIAAWIFSCTSILEVLQLWHPECLEIIRSTFLGKTLIGTTFAWWDFPHYLVGCCGGWYLMVRMKKWASAR